MYRAPECPPQRSATRCRQRGTPCDRGAARDLRASEVRTSGASRASCSPGAQSCDPRTRRCFSPQRESQSRERSSAHSTSQFCGRLGCQSERSCGAQHVLALGTLLILHAGMPLKLVSDALMMAADGRVHALRARHVSWLQGLGLSNITSATTHRKRLLACPVASLAVKPPLESRSVCRDQRTRHS
jgi:hypothetical protein